MKKVSIIIPIYNVEKYLSECLDSVIYQTYKDLEIICINDGSPDNSLSILGEYAKKDNRIVIINQENQGVAAARNNGLKKASGDYLFIMDSDDYINNTFIETSVNIAEQNNSDLVIVSKNIINTSKRILTPWELFIKKDYLDKYPDIQFPNDFKRGDDTFFVHKLLCLTNNISENNEAIYYYRKVATSITNGANQTSLVYNMQMQYFDGLDEFYTKYQIQNTPNIDKIYNMVLHIFISHYLIYGNSYTKEQKALFFEKTKAFRQKYHLGNFTHGFNKSAVWIANRLVNCKKWQDFEKYFLLIKIYRFLIKPFHKEQFNA